LDRLRRRQPEAPPLPLRPRVYTGLLLCDGSTDRYEVTLPPGARLRATVRHAPDAGDLALVLLPLPPATEPLGRSDGPHGVEHLSLPPSPVGRPGRLVVSHTRPGRTTPYTLDLQLALPDAPLGSRPFTPGAP